MLDTYPILPITKLTGLVKKHWIGRKDSTTERGLCLRFADGVLKQAASTLSEKIKRTRSTVESMVFSQKLRVPSILGD